LVRRPVLMFWHPSHRFNLFSIRHQAPLDSSHSVWDCKGRKLFKTCKLFFIFFLFLLQVPETPANLFPIISKSTSPSFLPSFPFFPKRVAKVAIFVQSARKKITFFSSTSFTFLTAIPSIQPL
ncbi:hypothetical protein, partial [Pedobacter sp.]|uniref:hypothetical protein n=1 Tax=Pedobacter sp. TaxID=1411316 RepID=UPI0031D0B887